MTTRDCATAAHLVRLLDSLSSPSSPPRYLALLNYAATARQARKVLDALVLLDHNNDNDRVLLLDLDTRLSAAEQQLARLAPVQSGSSSLLSPPAETIRAYRDSDPLLASLAADDLDLDSVRATSSSSSSQKSSNSVTRTKSDDLLVTVDSDSLESATSSSNPCSGDDREDRMRAEPSNPPSPADLRAASALGNRASASTTPKDGSSPASGAAAPQTRRPLLASSSSPGASFSSSSSLNPTLTTARPRRPQQQPTAVGDSNPSVSGTATGTGLATKTSLRDDEGGKTPPVPAYLAAKRARAAAAKAKAKQKLADASTAGSQDGGEEQRPGDDEDLDDAAVVKKLDDLIPADTTPVSDAGAGNDLLGQHHALQTSLLSSLTSLSGALKQSTLSFSDNLAKDKEVVTRAQEQLEQSEAGMKKQQVRLKEVRGKSRGTTCWTLGLLAIVFMLWFLTFLLIKVT